MSGVRFPLSSSSRDEEAPARCSACGAERDPRRRSAVVAVWRPDTAPPVVRGPPVVAAKRGMVGGAPAVAVDPPGAKAWASLASSEDTMTSKATMVGRASWLALEFWILDSR